jgi:hypothetical protein
MIQVIIDKDRPVGPTQRSREFRQCLHAQFFIVLPQDNVLVSRAVVYSLVMHAHADTSKSGNNGHFALYPKRDIPRETVLRDTARILRLNVEKIRVVFTSVSVRPYPGSYQMFLRCFHFRPLHLRHTMILI